MDMRVWAPEISFFVIAVNQLLTVNSAPAYNLCFPPSSYKNVGESFRHKLQIYILITARFRIFGNTTASAVIRCICKYDRNIKQIL